MRRHAHVSVAIRFTWVQTLNKCFQFGTGRQYIRSTSLNYLRSISWLSIVCQLLTPHCGDFGILRHCPSFDRPVSGLSGCIFFSLVNLGHFFSQPATEPQALSRTELRHLVAWLLQDFEIWSEFHSAQDFRLVLLCLPVWVWRDLQGTQKFKVCLASCRKYIVVIILLLLVRPY